MLAWAGLCTALTVHPAALPARAAGARGRVVVASAAAFKDDLLAVIGNEGLGAVPGNDQRTEVSEQILRLSSVNPTTEPARSSLINGKWDVVWSAAPGSGLADSPTRLLALALYAVPLSPSVLAQGLASLPFDAAKLGKLVVTIVSPDAGQPRVTAETSISLLSGAPTPIVLRSNLLARSGVALREDFVEIDALGQRSLLPGPLALSRSLYVTYLDEELLLVRDDSGLPSVLRRADKFPTTSAEPSYSDDDDAPGAG